MGRSPGRRAYLGLLDARPRPAGRLTVLAGIATTLVAVLALAVLPRELVPDAASQRAGGALPPGPRPVAGSRPDSGRAGRRGRAAPAGYRLSLAVQLPETEARREETGRVDPLLRRCRTRRPAPGRLDRGPLPPAGRGGLGGAPHQRLRRADRAGRPAAGGGGDRGDPGARRGARRQGRASGWRGTGLREVAAPPQPSAAGPAPHLGRHPPGRPGRRPRPDGGAGAAGARRADRRPHPDGRRRARDPGAVLGAGGPGAAPGGGGSPADRPPARPGPARRPGCAPAVLERLDGRPAERLVFEGEAPADPEALLSGLPGRAVAPAARRWSCAGPSPSSAWPWRSPCSWSS